MGPTAKQQRFVDEYFVDLNATQAAIRAKYSEKTAEATASRLLRNVKVQAEIERRRNELQATTQITQERVLQEYARLAFLDPRKLFNDDGSPKNITDIDDDTAAAITGLDMQELYEGYGDDREFVGYMKKYKLSDKKGALDSIAKHLGMFNVAEGETNNQTANEIVDALDGTVNPLLIKEDEDAN